MDITILVDSNNAKITDEMSTFIFNNGLQSATGEKLIITINEIPSATETFAIVKSQENDVVTDIISEITGAKVVREKDAYGRDAHYQDLIIITDKFDTNILKKTLLKKYAVNKQKEEVKTEEVVSEHRVTPVKEVEDTKLVEVPKEKEEVKPKGKSQGIFGNKK